MVMGRARLEDARNRSIRLPNRLWTLAERAAKKRKMTVNNLFWQFLEDYLVRHGFLKDEDRKRESLEGRE